ncbi:MAG: LPS export ABC transporter periplasmic protein LptC [Candidatus Rokuibacteriota bacterium]|jgi:LPS export ABC transporter protein LptC|nr:MAG: LPS export ABC transporter periplasmic protein LptC [Candidatus Rokubacteria bacterium]
MPNLARAILVIVAVFVVAVGITLVVRKRTAGVESLGPALSSADLRIKDVDLEEVTNGVRWLLRAEQALMYDQEGRTNLRNLTVRVFQKDRSWTILGDEGDLDQKTKNVEIRKNVVITSSDGLRMDTSVIHWDADAQRLWTDEPVTLSRDGSVIQGTAFDMTTDDENATVAGRVRATFTRSR